MSEKNAQPYVCGSNDNRLDVLAPRQREVCEASLKGLNSSQIAERLGISPSSVRVTLCRVYELLNVKDLRSLRREYGQCITTDTGGPASQPLASQEKCEIEGVQYPFFPIALFILSSTLLVLLLYFPSGYGPRSPEILDALRFGVPIGIVILCSPLFRFSSDRSCITLPINAVSTMSAVRGILMALSASTLIWVLHLQYVSTGIALLFTTAASASLVVLLLGAGIGLARSFPRCTASWRLGVLFFGGVAVLYILSRASRYSGIISIVLTLAISVLIPVLPWTPFAPHSNEKGKHIPPHALPAQVLSWLRGLNFLDYHALLAFFVVGQFLMRLLDPHQDGISLPLLVVASVALFAVRYSCHGCERRDFFAALILGVFTFFVYLRLGEIWFPFLAVFLFGLLSLWSQHSFSLTSISLFCSLALGMLYAAFLSFVDVYAVPDLEGILLYGHKALPAFFLSIGLSSLFPLLLTLFAVLAARHDADSRHVECYVEMFQHPETAMRLRSYCIFRGLNEVQCDVVVACVSGMSISDTAESLHYSVSAIKAARSKAFQVFGVYSCRDLQTMLKGVLEE